MLCWVLDFPGGTSGKEPVINHIQTFLYMEERVKFLWLKF